MQKGKLARIIWDSISELNGIPFKGMPLWSVRDKEFYFERYHKLLSLFPELNKESIGLEIGISGGILAFSLKKFFELKKLQAIEHPVTIKHFTNKYISLLGNNNIRLVSYDLEGKKIPLKVNSLDFIVMSEVLEHLVPAKIPLVLKEINRILKKDGLLLLTTPNIASLLKRLNLLRGKNPIEFDLRMHHGATYGHIREYSKKELMRIILDANFIINNFYYFNIDSNRNIHTKIETLLSKIFPGLSNNMMVVARKKN